MMFTKAQIKKNCRRRFSKCQRNMKEDDFLNNLAPFPVWVVGRKIELFPIEFRKIEKKI